MRLIIALAPPFLYAIGNILDKNLIQRYGYFAAPVIIVMSGFFAAFIVPTIALIGHIEAVPTNIKLVMMLSGILTSVSVYFYLKALEINSVLSVAPALQLAPIFSYLADIFIFSEQISALRLFGCLLVIFGSMLLTIRIENIEGKDSFHLKTFIFAAISSLALASSATLFKYFAITYNYWTVQFNEYTGVLLVGLLVFIFSKTVRNHIISVIKNRRTHAAFINLNIVTEGIMISGDFVLNFATLLLPLTFVFAMNGLQPVFLLAVGALIAYYIPTLHGDFAQHLKKKKILFSISIISIGVLLAVIAQ